MPFQLSPGVLIVEKDLTNIIPAVATSTGAFVGTFPWGPVLDPTLVDSEISLVNRFGKPQTDNATSFFTAANFLSYTNNLQLIRVDTDNHRNAVAVQSGTVTGVTITNGGTGFADPVTVIFGPPQEVGGVQATGHAIVGAGGAIESIIIDNPGSGYTNEPSITVSSQDGIGFVGDVNIIIGGIKINNEQDYMEQYVNGAGLVGCFAAKFPGALGNSIRVEMADESTFTNWVYNAEFDSPPNTSTYASSVGGANDEVHIIIIDDDGLWTGQRGAIIEKFAFASKASDARNSDGTNMYYKNVINTNSKYIWWMDHPESSALETSGSDWGSEAHNHTFKSLNTVYGVSLSGGVDDLIATEGQLMRAWSIFANAELYDISLLPTGQVTPLVAAYVLQNVVDARRDCVAFISPTTPEGSVIRGMDLAEQTVNFRNNVPFNITSSYGVLDSGWKYQYDSYNDVYRWVPLNGDIAGLCARTDYTNDPWWSPGGLNRGQIKNVVKLSFNPSKAERDELYKNGINPVCSFPGQGTVLFGDKTLLAKPSAFDRINVRRLFIVLEKAIAIAAKYQLFEFNDSFTRAQFRSMVEPFLRDVQGRRGIIDFRVKCDDTNNTGEVIDRNEFIADIYIKPARSINFITLNFVAVRTGVSFDEVGA
jgi:phage tail sheath protein FI